MKYLLCLLASLLLAGCATIYEPEHTVTNVRWSSSWDDAAVGAWDKQIKWRWPDRDVVALFCHGADLRSSTGRLVWYVFPDWPRSPQCANDVADALHSARPGCLVVMICCNPHGAPCYVHDTAYATDFVWIAPGPDYNYDTADGYWATYVGNISEFKVNE